MTHPRHDVHIGSEAPGEFPGAIDRPGGRAAQPCFQRVHPDDPERLSYTRINEQDLLAAGVAQKAVEHPTSLYRKLPTGLHDRNPCRQ